MLKIYNKRENVQISKNFNQAEFDCKCKNQDCTFTLLDLRVVDFLEDLRARTGEPVVLSSAFRCMAHNRSVGGVRNSFHKRGKAVDIILPTGWAMNDYVEEIKKVGFTMIIPYPDADFVHAHIATISQLEKAEDYFT